MRGGLKRKVKLPVIVPTEISFSAQILKVMDFGD